MNKNSNKLIAIELFPTIINVFKFHRNLNKKELTAISKYLSKTHKNNGNSISENKFVLNDPNLEQIKMFIDESLNQVLKETFQERTKLKITQSWLNKTEKEEYHHRHCHPNSYLSGVFYIETTDTDKIMFHRNSPRSNYYQAVYDSWNTRNSETWWLPVEMNSLIIFQSDVWHSVPKIKTKKRISLSFNTFINGTVGDETSAAYLDLTN